MPPKVVGFSMIPVTKDLYAYHKLPEEKEAQAYPVIAIAVLASETGDDNIEWGIDYMERMYLLAMPADEDAAWTEAKYIEGFFLKGESEALK